MCFAGMQAGLAERGFEVLRLNTYDTLPVESLPADVLATARQADVVAFASPSAVKAWHKLSGPRGDDGPAIACIGICLRLTPSYNLVQYTQLLFLFLPFFPLFFSGESLTEVLFLKAVKAWHKLGRTTGGRRACRRLLRCFPPPPLHMSWLD